MIDYLNIRPVPWGEECAQVGQDDYRERSARECRAFVNQIRRVVGPEPPGAQLVVKGFPHDFGTYYEVCCRYSDQHPDSEDYAFNCESHRQLEQWDDEARCELGLSAFAATTADS